MGEGRIHGLAGLKLTDASLEYPGGFTSLEDLSLGCTEITDARLENLNELPDLRRLHGFGCQLRNGGAKNIFRRG